MPNIDIELHSEVRKKTANRDLWKFNVMTFGVWNAPETFGLEKENLRGHWKEICSLRIRYYLIRNNICESLGKSKSIFSNNLILNSTQTMKLLTYYYLLGH